MTSPPNPALPHLALALLPLLTLGLAACVSASPSDASTADHILAEFSASDADKAATGTVTGYVLCRSGISSAVRCPQWGPVSVKPAPDSLYTGQAVDLDDYAALYTSCQEVRGLRDPNDEGQFFHGTYYCYTILTPRWSPPPPAPDPEDDGYRDVTPDNLGDEALYVLGEWHAPGEETEYPFVEAAPQDGQYVSGLLNGGQTGVFRGDPTDLDVVGPFEAGTTWGFDESLNLTQERVQDDRTVATLVFYRLIPYEAL